LADFQRLKQHNLGGETAGATRKRIANEMNANEPNSLKSSNPNFSFRSNESGEYNGNGSTMETSSARSTPTTILWSDDNPRSSLSVKGDDENSGPVGAIDRGRALSRHRRQTSKLGLNLEIVGQENPASSWREEKGPQLNNAEGEVKVRRPEDVQRRRKGQLLAGRHPTSLDNLQLASGESQMFDEQNPTMFSQRTSSGPFNYVNERNLNPQANVLLLGGGAETTASTWPPSPSLSGSQKELEDSASRSNARSDNEVTQAHWSRQAAEGGAHPSEESIDLDSDDYSYAAGLHQSGWRPSSGRQTGRDSMTGSSLEEQSQSPGIGVPFERDESRSKGGRAGSVSDQAEWRMLHSGSAAGRLGVELVNGRNLKMEEPPLLGKWFTNDDLSPRPVSRAAADYASSSEIPIPKEQSTIGENSSRIPLHATRNGGYKIWSNKLSEKDGPSAAVTRRPAETLVDLNPARLDTSQMPNHFRIDSALAEPDSKGRFEGEQAGWNGRFFAKKGASNSFVLSAQHEPYRYNDSPESPLPGHKLRVQGPSRRHKRQLETRYETAGTTGKEPLSEFAGDQLASRENDDKSNGWQIGRVEREAKSIGDILVSSVVAEDRASSGRQGAASGLSVEPEVVGSAALNFGLPEQNLSHVRDEPAAKPVATRQIESIESGQEDDESLMWRASQYLYMHMRAFAASSIYGVQVDVEWSNERTNMSYNSFTSRQEPSGAVSIGDGDSVSKDQNSVDIGTPFATIDLVPGQSLHLQCTG